MRILISNDDGIFAPGLAALVHAFAAAGHTVYVAAPDSQRSAASHSMTLFQPLTAKKSAVAGASKAWAIDGTPVDCVKLAVKTLCPEVDFVISGINHGYNSGSDVLYSGTVSAAEEAAMLGYRAVAVSRDTLGTDYFDDAAVHFCSNIDLFLGCLTESHRLLNVNYPYLPANEYRGIRVGYLAEQIYPIAYIEIKDENGSIGYKTPSNKLTSCAEHDTTDEKFVRDGFIAVTPLKYDITDYERLEQIAAFAERTY